jgi:hypothetical protein
MRVAAKEFLTLVSELHDTRHGVSDTLSVRVSGKWDFRHTSDTSYIIFYATDYSLTHQAYTNLCKECMHHHQWAQLA